MVISIGEMIIFVLLIIVLTFFITCGVMGNSLVNKSKIKINKIISDYNKQCQSVKNETLQTYPWLSAQFADMQFLLDEQIAIILGTKKRPAIKTANEVSKIAKEKRELQKLCKMYEYQLKYYESVIPWLEEFKEISPKDGWDVFNQIQESDEYESLRNWLSPEEYQNLSNSQKYQLALDRYKNRNKSQWEIGIEYERFIGYLYEQKGFKVKYHGALLGLEDMGRDLIVYKPDETLVIQCKRWMQEKTIHEKHIFQLYGSVVEMSIENKSQKYKGVFITTASLSDVAKKCADYLGIEYLENYKIVNYPLIKCNITKDGEKIYHLPFDQQYDRVMLYGKPDTCYVEKISQAEKLGFRRAFRWHPDKS